MTVPVCMTVVSMTVVSVGGEGMAVRARGYLHAHKGMALRLGLAERELRRALLRTHIAGRAGVGDAVRPWGHNNDALHDRHQLDRGVQVGQLAAPSSRRGLKNAKTPEGHDDLEGQKRGL